MGVQTSAEAYVAWTVALSWRKRLLREHYFHYAVSDTIGECVGQRYGVVTVLAESSYFPRAVVLYENFRRSAVITASVGKRRKQKPETLYKSTVDYRRMQHHFMMRRQKRRTQPSCTLVNSAYSHFNSSFSTPNDDVHFAGA
jgi:hypothetical protein